MSLVSLLNTVSKTFPLSTEPSLDSSAFLFLDSSSFQSVTDLWSSGENKVGSRVQVYGLFASRVNISTFLFTISILPYISAVKEYFLKPFVASYHLVCTSSPRLCFSSLRTMDLFSPALWERDKVIPQEAEQS